MKVDFTEQELFQLHLCVVTRTADATIKWANASSKEEQTNAQNLIGFLTMLQKKIGDYLSDANDKETSKKEEN